MNPADFNLRHLRALAAAIRLGSLTAAAKALGITQPAVTQAIGRLESLVGAKLLDRSGGRAQPTDAGLLLAARGEGAAAALAEAFQSTRKGGIGGRAGAEADVTMAQITALIALADHGSYAAGAAALGLTQPSLHRAVGDLERLSGVLLAERSGRGVGLTEAGGRLAAACRLAMAELRAASDELAVLAGRDQGTIRVGAHPDAFAQLLPTAIARFLAEHPPVVVEIDEADGASGIDRLVQGRIDALIALDGDAIGGPGIERTPLTATPLVVVARAGHPLGAGTPGLLRLAQARWALPPVGSRERRAWERLFLDGGLYPEPPGVTWPSVSALLDLVERSELLTVAPQALVEAAGSRLAIVGEPLSGGGALVLATRANWAPTPAQATFLDEVRAAGDRTLAF